METSGTSDPGTAAFCDLLAAGDVRRAAEWLVHRHADEVVGLCVAMVSDRAAGEDLAQDAFGRAFAGLAQFRGEASPRTWLLRIARNRCIDYLRARSRDPWDNPAFGSDEEPDEHPDSAPLPPDLLLRRSHVQTALSQLTEGERALVVLRFRNGLDYRELANAFGLREGAVRMRVSRALAKMRQVLEEPQKMMAGAAVAPQIATPAGRARNSAPTSPPRGAPHSAPAALPAPGGPPRASAPRPAVGVPLAELDSSLPAPRSAPEMLGGAPAHTPADIMIGAQSQGLPPRKERGGGLLGHIRDFFRGHGEPPATPAPPAAHPLTEYFAAEPDARSEQLRGQLMKQARGGGPWSS